MLFEIVLHICRSSNDIVILKNVTMLIQDYSLKTTTIEEKKQLN